MYRVAFALVPAATEASDKLVGRAIVGIEP